MGSRRAEKGEEAKVEDGWDPHIQALSDVARAALEKATEALEREDLEASTPAEVRALCESAAGSSDLEACLRAGAVDTVLSTGVATNVCCEATARDAIMRDVRTIMVSDCLAARTDEEHYASLSTLYLYFGDVQARDQVIASLTAAGALDPPPRP